MNERLEELASSFFEKVLTLCSRHPVDYVVVTHLLEDRPWFLRAVNQLGRVVAVIPKRKSIIPRVRSVLSHQYNLLNIGRSDLSSVEGLRQHLGPLQGDRPLCLLDIGGYFAPLMAMNPNSTGLNIAGIVEDTENGHVKYERSIAEHANPFPVASVARSDLKRPENFLIGQSLVFSVEAIFRQRDELLHGRRACVIGYGNIGRSVAQHLHMRHVNVSVFDNDPIKLVEAFTHGFYTPATLKEALAEADVVFCVTGNRSIGLEELSHLKPFTYIATVTSPDDELRTDELDLSNVSHRDGHVSELRLRDRKVVYLMNRGQAVNFVHGSVVGPFIQLLQGEILVTASEMLSRPPIREVKSISVELKREIVRKWLEVYRH
jgi:adenosylhomocysteinase